MHVSTDDNPTAERRHAAAAPLSKAPTHLTGPSYRTVSTTSDGDSSTISSSQLRALRQRQQQQHLYAAANSITGCFSDISGRYSVDPSRVLGTGAGATVYECEDLATGERYAVKTVAKGRRRGAGPRDLHREVSLLSDLRDEAREGGEWRPGRCGGVVELVDLHEDSFNLHIVTELCRGGTLSDRIHPDVGGLRPEAKASRGGGLPEDVASAVLRQVLAALEFLHSRDICHRDVNPENILFVHRGAVGPPGDVAAVRLVDLGSARYHHATSFEPHMSTLVGTCPYVAPEVLRMRYDRRCDHWSLGVVSYAVMCGYPPFAGGADEEVHDAVLRGRFWFHPKHWGDVSKEARGFVRGLMKVNARSRMGGEAAMKHPFISGGGTRAAGGGDERGAGACGGPSPVSLYVGPPSQRVEKIVRETSALFRGQKQRKEMI